MKRLEQLDFLRGIAILLVLFTHFKIINFLYQVGWIGVDLFFVLSGFLVSGLLFAEYKKHKNLKLGRFLIRRGFKIYPLFYLFILISIMAGKLFPLEGYDLNAVYYAGVHKKTVLAEVLFLQNYLGGIWINTWSLAVEEHFYIGIGLILLFLTKTHWIENKKAFVSGILLISLLNLTLRVLNYVNHPDFYYLTHLFPTHLRMDSLLFGVLIAYLYHFDFMRLSAFVNKYRVLLFVFALIFISSTFFFHIKSFFMNTIGLTLVYLGFGMLLMLLVLRPESNRLIPKLISRRLYNIIGKTGYYSYSIYIWHLFIKHYSLYLAMKYVPGLNEGLYFLIYFVLAILTGVLMARLIEIPFLRIRDKYFPRREAPLNPLSHLENH